MKPIRPGRAAAGMTVLDVWGEGTSEAGPGSDRADGGRHPSVSEGRIGGMRLGIGHHFGWAVAINASTDHPVVDRRRSELIERGVPAAPIHHDGGPTSSTGRPSLSTTKVSAALAADVHASVFRTASSQLLSPADGATQ